MNVEQAIIERRSRRAYLDKPVDIELVKHIIDVAKWAPSMSNVQPWEVTIIPNTSPKRKELVDALWSRLKTDPTINSPFCDSTGYPDTWKNPYLKRKRLNGLQVYKALGVPRDDPDGKDKHWANNYNSFDAPIQMFFTLDDIFNRATYMEVGAFMQNINLVALEHGLGTCLQGSLAEYWEQVKDVLDIPENKIVMCGMAMGYIDHEAPVNQVKPDRISVDDIITIID